MLKISCLLKISVLLSSMSYSLAIFADYPSNTKLNYAPVDTKVLQESKVFQAPKVTKDTGVIKESKVLNNGIDKKDISPIENNINLYFSGAAKRSFLFFSIYDVALYLPENAKSLAEPYMLWITYQRDLSASKIESVLVEGIEKNSDESVLSENINDFNRQLKPNLTSVNEGDSLKLIRLSEDKADVLFRDRYVVSLFGVKFLDSLFDIWLGESAVVSPAELLRIEP